MSSTLNAATSGGLTMTSDTSGILKLQTASTDAVTITAAQNVGIGTASPSSYSSKTLQVTGSSTDVAIKLTNSTTGTGNASGFDFELNGNDINYVNRTASGNQKFWTNSTERMRLDSSGNLGLGVTPSASWNSGYKAIQIANASYGSLSGQVGGASTMQLTWNAYATGADAWAYLTTGDGVGQYIMNGGQHRWRTAASGTAGNAITWTQAMTLDSSGNLLVGTTSSPSNARFRAYGNASADFSFGPQTGTGNDAFIVYNQSNVGVYLVSGNTSWTGTSDERKKDIIEPITNAANKVASLRAVIGKFKTDEEGTRRSFLIAQDVQAVLPEAVSIGKDEDETLGIQYTEVIPLLVAAIKEMKEIIDQQSERITALEGAAQ